MAHKPHKRRHTPWKWRVEWLAQTMVEKLAAALPGSWVFRLGELLGGVAWVFMGDRRRIVLRNLRVAFHGEHNLPTLRLMVRQSFSRTGANLLSALHTAGLSMKQVDSIITVENPELVEEALQKAPGLVLLPCHMGNWEILTRIHSTFPAGHASGAMYRPLNNPLLDARVLAQREMEGTRLFSKRDNFHQIIGFLREGGILGILADQRMGMQGELVYFFGRLTRASPLPSLMARRSKSQVLGMSLITDSPGKWRIRYLPLNGPVSTAACMDAIERSMKSNPLDVFWFQDRWRVYVRPWCPVRDWLGKDSSPGKKAHRALLWLVGAPAEWTIPEEWTHPDVIYEVVLAPGQPKPIWCMSWEITHTVPPGGNRKNLRKALAALDLAAPLPIDYILTHDASAVLEQAAKDESITLVSLASTRTKMTESSEPADEFS